MQTRPAKLRATYLQDDAGCVRPFGHASRVVRRALCVVRRASCVVGEHVYPHRSTLTGCVESIIWRLVSF